MRKWHDGRASTSHDLAVDSLGRMTKYVYDNPESGRAVVVLNCSHKLDQQFSDGEAHVKASIDFQRAPGGGDPIMRLSVVVMLRKEEAGRCAEEGDELQQV